MFGFYLYSIQFLSCTFTLQEGVNEFSLTTKNIPWRKILEYGRHVFHETRSPMDLKDKWRNMDRDGDRVNR